MAGYVELYRLGKTYPTRRGPAVIVQEFNLNMDEGEFVALIGHSGCGKSTVLSMIAGLTPISEGSVIVARREIEGAGPDRGVVFQSPCLLPWMTAEENVLLGVSQVQPLLSYEKRRAVARKYLALVDLEHAAELRPASLSQGMRQRVGIARALALTPNMLLLDEPLGMLDSLTKLELQDVLCRILEQDRRTTLMVTHDIDEALYLSDRIVMMTSGPAATVGEIIEVPFPRPRRRQDVLEHPEYYAIRERLIDFLENHHVGAQSAAV
jgi:nitrate ABC transporter ATP-binding subunit